MTMPKSHGNPKPIEAQMESSKSEDREQTDSPPVPQEEESVPEAGANVESVQSEDWWSMSEPAPDWSQPETEAPATEVIPRKEPGTADVYFCGNTSVFPFNRALQAIAKEKLTGLLRSFWDQEPIDLLARDGEIVLVTTRDPDLYCPETPSPLAAVDPVIVVRARDPKNETGTPFFLSLARQASIAHEQAVEFTQYYGQKLFSQLWTAPRAWIMFEKNADLLSDAGDMAGEPSVSNWALETLRLVKGPEQAANVDTTCSPAFTKDELEHGQNLQMT